MYNVGSPAYMSPEAFRYNEYSHSSDIWAIGVIFYQMLTGQLPWRSKTEEELNSRFNDNFIRGFIQKGKFGEEAKKLMSRMLKVKHEERINGEELIDFFNEKKKEQIGKMKLNIKPKEQANGDESEITELSSPLWTHKKKSHKEGGFNLTLKPFKVS